VLATLAALTTLATLAGLLLLLAGLLLAAALLLLAGFLLAAAAALLAAATLLTALVRVLIGHLLISRDATHLQITTPRIALKFLAERDANASKDGKIKAKSGETAPAPRPHTGL
jgi:hypothetical protein